MREIVFDTETTGLDPFQGDRLVEIGCIELINRFPSGKTFHCYFNPQRDMPETAQKIHGLTIEFLNDKPLFAEKVEELMAFIAEDPLIAHNAMFDLGFLNAELERAGRATVSRERMVDTLLIARRKHPGGSNRLDDLCARYAIDNSRRTKHGALLDAELLAEVYVELTAPGRRNSSWPNRWRRNASLASRLCCANVRNRLPSAYRPRRGPSIAASSRVSATMQFGAITLAWIDRRKP